MHICSVPGLDLEIIGAGGGGGGHPDPQEGGPVSKKIFLGPVWSVGVGEAGPSRGSTTDVISYY